MSIKQAADYIRSQGRNNDTQLMHVTPGEVDALQSIARAKGGSLTINPSTGLPEAGFLEDFLPTIAGIGVGVATGNPFLGAAVAGGGSYAITGSLQKGLMSGLGAFGGASALGGLASTAAAPALASTAAAGTPAAAMATDIGSMAAMDAGLAGGNYVAQQAAAQGVASGAASQLQGQLALNALPAAGKFSALGQGFSNLASDPSGTFAQMGGLSGQGRNMAMLGSSILGAGGGGGDDSTATTASGVTIRPSAYDPVTQRYTQLAPVAYEDWGDNTFESYRKSQGYAEGGDVVEQRYQQPTRTVDPTVTAYNDILMQQANQQYVQGVPIKPTISPNLLAPMAAYEAAQADPAKANTTSDIIYDPKTQRYSKNPNYVAPVTPVTPVDTNIGNFGGFDPWSMGNQNDGTGGSSAGNDGNGGGGGGGGGGDNAGGCVDPNVLVLMADKTQKRAGDIQIGEVVYTPHEHTFEYGDFRVLAKNIIQQPKIVVKFEDQSTIKVSDTHKFLMDDKRWKQMIDIKLGDTVSGIDQNKTIIGLEYVGDGDVVEFVIEDAHTYVSEGLISHNSKKAGGLIKRMASGGITDIAKFQAGGDMSSDAFVVPADVVSALGNGSTDAGMRALNAYLGRASQIEGAGDGLSDDVPATIEGEQPAQVADGEAYIDPQTVAGLGGGNSEKGAAKLYAMMDQIRKSAHGKTSQQKKVNPNKVMPV